MELTDSSRLPWRLPEAGRGLGSVVSLVIMIMMAADCPLRNPQGALGAVAATLAEELHKEM